MADQSANITGRATSEAAAVALTELVMRAEPDGPNGTGWTRQAVFRTYRRCIHVIDTTSRKPNIG